MPKIIKNGIEYGGGTAVVPVASASTLGAIKVGRGLSISAAGVLSRDDTVITYTALGDVVDPVFTLTEDNKYIITWTDPDDIQGSGGGYLAQWAYTMLVRKYNGIPQSPTDGTVICTSRLRDEFSVNGFKDVNLDMSHGALVFYRFFTVTTDDFHTYGEPHMFVNGSFGSISDANLATLLQKHYNGELDISQVFSIGDTREIQLSAMEAEYVAESHVAQTITVRIIDFDHDDLTTPINGKTKAALTLDMTHSLIEQGAFDSTGNRDWNTCQRRDWCNDTFYNALPSTIKSCVKQVTKEHGSYRPNSDDYCWYLSSWEANNTTYSSFKEGSPYPVFTNESSRIKKTSTGSSTGWATCSYSNNGSNYILVFTSSGSAGGGNPNIATRNIFVNFCL